MREFPFEVRLSLPRQPTAYRVQISLHPQARSVLHPLTGEVDTRDPSDEMVRLFAEAAGAQLFRVDATTASRFVPVSGGKGDAGAVWTYVFDVAAVAPEADVILLALLAQCLHQGDPLGGVAIEADDSGRDPVTTEALVDEDTVVPQAAGRPDSVITRDDDVIDGDGFAVRLEFARAPQADVQAAAEHALGVWDEIRILGGFLFDGAAQDATGNLGAIDLHEPTVIQLSVMDFWEGDASGLTLLTNLALGVHAQQSLRALVVE